MLKAMNGVDVLILLLLVLAVFRGIQAGLLQLLLSSVGFIGGLLLGSWLAGRIAPHFSGPFTKIVVILSVVLGLAVILSAVGQLAGLKLSIRAIKLHLGKANQVLGACLEVIFVLLAVWLITPALTNIRSGDIGHEVSSSFIVRRLDSVLSHPPDVVARLEKIISPNGFPDVFLGLEPQHTTVSPHNSVSNKAILAAEKSVVKIQGVGCGGIVNGSGFVVDKNIVVTNAHVVAGIANSQVVDRFGTYRATAIWFDPNLDIAILRVNNLPEPALKLASQILPDKDAVAVLGFPGGGPLVVDEGAIIDHVTAAGRNIYNRGVVLRNIYEVQADVEPGNSGGPLLAPDGSVAGVVFAKSLSQNNVGYALLINQVKKAIAQAEQRNSPVATGTCAAD